jgi:beta-galactosidase
VGAGADADPEPLPRGDHSDAGRGAVDRYETRFGIRELRFDPEQGVFVNGEHIYIKGANQHHDLGALGAAFNVRAAERQLEMLQEMGANAIRTAHNPPAPELLELTDRMGLLVVDELADVWERRKTPLDSHLIFPEKLRLGTIHDLCVGYPR